MLITRIVSTRLSPKDRLLGYLSRLGGEAAYGHLSGFDRNIRAAEREQLITELQNEGRVEVVPAGKGCRPPDADGEGAERVGGMTSFLIRGWSWRLPGNRQPHSNLVNRAVQPFSQLLGCRLAASLLQHLTAGAHYAVYILDQFDRKLPARFGRHGILRAKTAMGILLALFNAQGKPTSTVNLVTSEGVCSMT